MRGTLENETLCTWIEECSELYALRDVRVKPDQDHSALFRVSDAAKR